MNFHGVLYRTGAEQKIRKYLIENNFVDTVIQLPDDLFFGTTIGTCIIVLKKSKADNSVLFIDASSEFVRGGNKNKLTDDNINNILKLIKDRTNVDYKSVLISNEEIGENDYNISVNTYLRQETQEQQIDIKEHNKKVKDIVKREQELRLELDKIIDELEVMYGE